jgi:hypothetical protein
MFKRRNAGNRGDSGPAGDEASSPKPFFDGAAADRDDASLQDAPLSAPEADVSAEAAISCTEDDGIEFPPPNRIEVPADGAPADEDERVAVGDVPFDEDGAFAQDADADEFLEGSADAFVDDVHDDFYQYGDKVHGVNDGPAAEPSQTESGEPIAAVPLAASGSRDAAGAHGKHGRAESKRGRESRKAKKMQGESDVRVPDHQVKSRRMRKVLLAIVLLLVILLMALVYFSYQLFQTSNTIAAQQSTGSANDVASTAQTDNSTKDASSTNVKKTDVPALLGLMGKNQADAVKLLGHGATVTLSADVNEEGNPVKKKLTVVLTDEPADSKSGTPTVYLGLNEGGLVVMAGYSAATASLGYGSFSFADAVSNEHVVEKTLDGAGLNVPDGTVVLPQKTAYSTYAGDGTTLLKEQSTFSGSANVGGANYSWSAVLVYNYTAANASGNLADTVRQIYIYINAA